jgi:hypothetical protein
VPILYSEQPPAIQAALQQIALFDWHRHGGGEDSRGIEKPDPWLIFNSSLAEASHFSGVTISKSA